MKKLMVYMSVAIGLLATSCRKEYKEIGDNPSKVDGITASWVLTGCSIIDKAATVEETMDVTSFFTQNGKLPNVHFVMENGTGTYSSDSSNVAYNFFGGTGGTWTFDNADYPTKVILTPAGSAEPVVLMLAATIRPTDTYLKLDKSVLCGGVEKSVYRISFTRN
jgi:hypothetical protein